MDIGFLLDYFVPIIAGICLCLGYILKLIPMVPNQYIPIINASVGVGLAFWVHGNMTPEILLAGLFSGLSATGLYEAFKNLIEKKDGVE